MKNEFKYLGMSFLFIPLKEREGDAIIVHKLSGHVAYSRFQIMAFGNPRGVKTAKKILAGYVESSTHRKEVLNTYKEKYKE